MVLWIIGLGSVGTLTADIATAAGYRVVGIDSDSDKPVWQLGRGGSAADGYDYAPSPDVIVLAIPGPNIGAATALVARTLDRHAEATLLIESTLPVGGFRLLERALPGLIRVAYVPHRVSFGYEPIGLRTRRLAGVRSNAAWDCASAFYSSVGIALSRCTPEEAEMAKLFENAYRFINVAFVNEVATLCSRVGVEPLQVVRLAETKEFGFASFFPGAGIGGECVPQAIQELLRAARERGLPLPVAEVALRENQSRREAIVSAVVARAHPRARVLLVGVGYKPGDRSGRGSVSVEVMGDLRSRGFDTRYHDPLVLEVNGSRSASLVDSVSWANVIVVVVKQVGVSFDSLLDAGKPLLDATYTLPVPPAIRV